MLLSVILSYLFNPQFLELWLKFFGQIKSLLKKFGSTSLSRVDKLQTSRNSICFYMLTSF